MVHTSGRAYRWCETERPRRARVVITAAEEVVTRVKIALAMLPHVIDVPITDSEIVEVAEHAPPSPRLHSAFVAREFILERQAWIPAG
jgi:hypothetical protein